jgi:hypothetical protein
MNLALASMLHLVILTACACIGGCTFGGDSTVAAENDKLRRANHDQNLRITALESQLVEARAQVGAAAQSAPNVGYSAEVAALIPRITTITIERLSGFIPHDAGKTDLPATAVVAYVTFSDGRGRFTQGVGTLTVQATYQGSALTSTVLQPTAVRDAYRSGITGTYYEIELPLATPLRRAGKTQLTIDVTFADAQTGLTHTATRTIER